MEFILFFPLSVVIGQDSVFRDSPLRMVVTANTCHGFDISGSDKDHSSSIDAVSSMRLSRSRRKGHGEPFRRLSNLTDHVCGLGSKEVLWSLYFRKFCGDEVDVRKSSKALPA